MDLDANVARLAVLLEDKLDVHGAGFEAKLARAGRLLPRHLRSEGAVLVAALRVEAHPRLSRQLDEARLTQAFHALEKHLLDINPWDRRRAIVLDWLASNVFNLLVVAAVVVAVLAWRGFL